MRIAKYFRVAAWLFVLLCACKVPAAPSRFTADLVALDRLRTDRYDELVAQTIEGDEIEQARFAEIAIDVLIDTFEKELDPNNTRLAVQSGNDKGWRAGTRSYIEELKRLNESISRGATVEMIKERRGDVRIVVGHKQVMLSAPRLDEQKRLESRIAEHACLYTDCARQSAMLGERVNRAQSDPRNNWELTQGLPPSYVGSDGLRCIFTDERHLKLKKQACLAIVREVRLLAEALASLRSHGKAINWQTVRIEHVGPGETQKLVYNLGGGFVRMDLPNLLRAQDVWRSAMPWVEASVNGRLMQHVIKLPDQLAYQVSNTKSSL